METKSTHHIRSSTSLSSHQSNQNTNNNFARDIQMPRQISNNYYRANLQTLQNRPLSRQILKKPIQNKKQTTKITKIITQPNQNIDNAKDSSLLSQIIKLRNQSIKKTTNCSLKNKLITEATFKPYNHINLKLQLNIRKIFNEKFKKQADNAKKKEKVIEIKDTKTKYQKILQQFFNQNDHQENHIPKQLYKTFNKRPSENIKPNKQQKYKDLYRFFKVDWNNDNRSMKKCKSEAVMSNCYQNQVKCKITKQNKLSKQNKVSKQNEVKEYNLDRYSNRLSKQKSNKYIEIHQNKVKNRG